MVTLSGIKAMRGKAKRVWKEQITEAKQTAEAIPFTNKQLKQLLIEHEAQLSSAGRCSRNEQNKPKTEALFILKPEKLVKAMLRCATPELNCSGPLRTLQDCLVITRPKTSLRTQGGPNIHMTTVQTAVKNELPALLSLNLSKTQIARRPWVHAGTAQKLVQESPPVGLRGRDNSRCLSRTKGKEKGKKTSRQRLANILFITHYGEKETMREKQEKGATSSKLLVPAMKKPRQASVCKHRRQKMAPQTNTGMHSVCENTHLNLKHNDSFGGKQLLNVSVNDPVPSATPSRSRRGNVYELAENATVDEARWPYPYPRSQRKYRKRHQGCTHKVRQTEARLKSELLADPQSETKVPEASKQKKEKEKEKEVKKTTTGREIEVFVYCDEENNQKENVVSKRVRWVQGVSEKSLVTSLWTQRKLEITERAASFHRNFLLKRLCNSRKHPQPDIDYRNLPRLLPS